MEIQHNQVNYSGNFYENRQAQHMAELAEIELSPEQISDYILMRDSHESFFRRQTDQSLLFSILTEDQRVLFCKFFSSVRYENKMELCREKMPERN